ncbi:hypothetical protein FAI41_02195 [Acetobacteraceae bacterium]|nr:hypothetical protein FAI41_02195 [Acetobacteraceae bacterium]
MNFTRFLSFLFFLWMLAFFTVSAFAQEKDSLVLPQGDGLIDEWFSHLPINVMMGTHVTAAAVDSTRTPWLYPLFPFLYAIKIVPVGGMAPERIISLHPRLVILPAERKDKAGILKNAGLHVEVLDFTDYAGLLACIQKSAQLENTALALEKARIYKDFLIENLREIPTNLEGAICQPNGSLPNLIKVKPDAPKVLHLSSLEPLKADGKNTIIDEWIRMAGGQNIFTFSGNKKEITWEQIYAWNPDIIILQANAGKWEKGKVPTGAFLLKAFKENHLYRNPAGLFLWDRSGPELPLQALWASAIISGRGLESQGIKKKMHFFYQTFYGLNLSDEILEKILKGEGP